MACLGVTESCGGSDVANIQVRIKNISQIRFLAKLLLTYTFLIYLRTQTKAVRDGDNLVINGEKMWITNGMCADWMSLLVNTSVGGSKHRNKSLVCLPLNLKGF